MNKVTKILVSILIAAVILLGSVFGVLYFGMGIDIFDRSGWNTNASGEAVYLDYHGDPLTGWQLIDGNWYYLDPADGGITTGWTEIDGSRYYLDETGVRRTGWLTLEEGTYYISTSNGSMATGWMDTEDGRCYLDEATGLMRTGWMDWNGSRYYLDESGIMSTGWLDMEEGRYLLDDTGAMVTGWITTTGGICYLDSTTGTLTIGWLENEDGRCYFDENGYLATGWTDTDEGRYYLDGQGQPTTGWLDTEEGRYLLDDTGIMTTGWYDSEDGKRYYFREDGRMAVGKVIIDDVANYFTSTGAYVVLVNRWNSVPEDYEVELVSYSGWQMANEVYFPLVEMLSDCPYYYKITSAYRSKSSQQAIWDKRLANYQASGYSYEGALALVEAYVAVPGTSEHQLGLAIDISGSDAGCQWLAENCWEYGFILRYPEGKEDITGIYYERWHFRYVGTELALELRDLDLTLEEYMDMLTASQNSDAGTASSPELYTNCYSSGET